MAFSNYNNENRAINDSKNSILLSVNIKRHLNNLFMKIPQGKYVVKDSKISHSLNKITFKNNLKVDNIKCMQIENETEIENAIFNFDQEHFKKILYNKFYIVKDKTIYCLLCQKFVPKNKILFFIHIRSENHLCNQITMLNLKNKDNKIVKKVKNDKKKKRKRNQSKKENVEKNFEKKKENVESKKNNEETIHSKENDDKEKNKNVQKSQNENKDSILLISNLLEIKNPNYIFCHCCSNVFKNFKRLIGKHVESREHIQKLEQTIEKSTDYLNNVVLAMQNELYFTKYYCCIICNIKYETKIIFLEHFQKIHNGKLSKNCIADFCIPCATVWISRKDIYDWHCNHIIHKYFIERNDLETDELSDPINKFLLNSNKYLHEFEKTNFSIMGRYNGQKYMNTIGEILQSGLYNREKVSNLLDVQIIEYSGIPNHIEIYTHNESFLKSNSEYLETEYNSQLYKFVSENEKICGLHWNIYNRCGISTYAIIIARELSSNNFICKKIIAYLNKWCLLCGMHGLKGITNLSLSWLVIFYLETQLIIPDMISIKKYIFDQSTEINWNDLNINKNSQTAEKHNIEKLLLEFFDFYANFDFKQHVACPSSGKIVTKQELYKHYHSVSGVDATVNYMKTFNTNSAVFVQDPFNPLCNITNNINYFTLKCFKTFCYKSSLILMTKKI